MGRLVSHPSIDFGSGRGALHRPRLGLKRAPTVYHRPRRARSWSPTVSALRSQTSQFRFPAVGRIARRPARRPALPFGLSRGRRA